MKIFFTYCSYVFFYIIFVCCLVYAVPYDHSYTPECLEKPLAPLYNGGIIVNAEFNKGLKGWTAFGDHVELRVESNNDNKYVVVSKRNEPHYSFSQKFKIEKNKLYSFSGWLQISNGNAASIEGVVKIGNGEEYEKAGWVNARSGCWSMIKGGFVAKSTGFAELYFESKNTEVEIWGDSISLQPFTQEEWQSHNDRNIELVRKKKTRVQVVDQQGHPLRNANVSVKQTRPNFPLGCAINQNILNNQAYKTWFLSRFKTTVFENELKWYSTERTRGQEDYSAADALVSFAKSNGVSIRGHNIFWDDPQRQPSWVPGLSPQDLSAAANKRINSVVTRYRGKFFHWDVLNENLHFGFFSSKLGAGAANGFFKTTNTLDGNTVPFLNDYNTIEDSRDGKATPAQYLNKINEIRKSGYNGPLGIGLEGHFSIAPNMAYIRSSLDQLSSARLPIWITELDVASMPNQANYLDQILRELYAQKSVQGIMIWSAWSPQGCYRMCLTDNSFKNLATGDVVDKFRRQLLSHPNEIPLSTDSDGFIEASLFSGEYQLVSVGNSHGDGVSGSSAESSSDAYLFTFQVQN